MSGLIRELKEDIIIYLKACLIFVVLFIGYFIPFSFYPDAIKPNDINENYTLFSFAYPFLPIIAIGGFLLALFVYVRRST